jgi:hypothetical protein
MGGYQKDTKINLAGCDIPELCPGVGPSMGGYQKDAKFGNVGSWYSVSCDIPELCPGVGPSMGGAIEDNRL